MGEIRLMQERAAEAVPLLEQARGLHGTSVPILTALAQAYLRLGRLADAEIVLHSALARGATEHAAPLLADLLIRTGRASQARDLLHTAARRTPDQASVHQALVRVLHALGETESAAAHAAGLRRQAPSSPLGFLAEAALCVARGDLDGALTQLARAQALDDTHPETLCALGAVLLRLGHAAEAHQAYALARRVRPEDDVAYRGYALAATALEDLRPRSARPPTT
jgi:Flp pilus assembly protein TadD